MAQSLPCLCWWCNYNGIPTSCAILCCICGYWPNKNDQMKLHTSQQDCQCLKSAGFGFNCDKIGIVLCAPQWLVNYSRTLKSTLV